MAVDTPAKIAVLGAGPMGLEAALYARFLGYDVNVFERGQIAENVRRWGHLEMPTPFARNCSPLGLAAIRAQDADYQPPKSDALLTGRQWVDHYLVPVAQTDLLADHIECGVEVRSVANDSGRKTDAFDEDVRFEGAMMILLRDSTGEERMVEADVVLDATGVYGNRNHLGPGGLPAVGETRLYDEIEYGLPDVLGAEKSQYAGSHTLVIGETKAAFGAVRLLATLAKKSGGKVTWVTQNSLSAIPDRELVEDETVTHWGESSIRAVRRASSDSAWEVELDGVHQGVFRFDRLVANVGYRPNREIFAELRIDLSAGDESPRLLAEYYGNVNATLDVQTRRNRLANAMIQNEPNFYLLGEKTFGRREGFTFADGLEQIQALFSVIGDRPDLNLYESVGPTL